MRGPLAAALNQPMPQARTAALAPVGGSTTAAPAATSSYSVAVGGGARDFTVALALHAHNYPAGGYGAAAGPETVASSSSLDLAWTWLRFRHVSTNVHAGGAGMLLVDRATGDHAMGEGFRYGAALAVNASIVTAFVDYYRVGVVFGGGPATGFSELSGVMLGLMIRQ
ncbi:MAG: hypothetical protein ACM31C_14515 [Acidobacteriota bacterium]